MSKNYSNRIFVYDTTLRDGGQASGVSFSVADKIRIMEKLQSIEVDYIEAGWPGANRVDTVLFEKVKQGTSLKSANLENGNIEGGNIKGGGLESKSDASGENKDIRLGRTGASEKDTASLNSGGDENINFTSFNLNTLCCFGMTCRAGTDAKDDQSLNDLANCGAKIATIVGKAWMFHVKNALKITGKQNCETIRKSIKFLREKGMEVIFDAEHFFDGFREHRDYSLECIREASLGGASWIVLCDTNGGTLPYEVEEIVRDVCECFPDINFGVHCHNDTECAVANTISAVRGGARLIQGTINGLGERCGNANLLSVVANLTLKMDYDCGKIANHLEKFTKFSRFMDNILNNDHNVRLPYVGGSAFAHKGGLHASAVLSNPSCYEHIAPELVGNKRTILVSNQSGRSNIVSLLRDIGITDEKYYTSEALKEITSKIKEMEVAGYNYEDAEASLAMLVYRTIGNFSPSDLLKINSYEVRVVGDDSKSGNIYNLGTRAIATIKFGESAIAHSDESDGPVGALYNIMIKVFKDEVDSSLSKIDLADYRVRIIKNKIIDDDNEGPDASVVWHGTDSVTKVNVEFYNHKTGMKWRTAGISKNIIDASFIAIYDAICFFVYNKKSDKNA